MKFIVSALLFAGLCSPAFARDFGSPRDVRQIKTLVNSKMQGRAANVAVSHNWAMCASFTANTAMSVILHRVGGRWTIVDKDGGAYEAALLRHKGVPAADIKPIMRTYQ